MEKRHFEKDGESPDCGKRVQYCEQLFILTAQLSKAPNLKVVVKTFPSGGHKLAFLHDIYLNFPFKHLNPIFLLGFRPTFSSSP